MKYECKQCGTKFMKDFGKASCPQCGSNDLWTTGGEVKAVLIILTVQLAILIFLFLLSPSAFLGGIIASLLMLPVIVYSIFKRRKKTEEKWSVGDPNENWQCPQCNGYNPNNAYKCEHCGYRIIWEVYTSIIQAWVDARALDLRDTSVLF